MTEVKKKMLEANGMKVVDSADWLGLTKEESQLVDMRVALAEELERVRESWPFGQEPMRVIDRGLYKSLLVPNRALFRELFPSYACDRASIDDVMTLIVKGKVS